MNYKDITPHTEGLLCACYDCRKRKGSTVRKSIVIEPKVMCYQGGALNTVELKHVYYELQQYVNNETMEYRCEYVPVGG